MSRERSPLIVGDYWLDKRRDGLAPEVWQVATYSTKSRSTVYRSTKQRSLDEAKAFLRAYEADKRSTTKHQDPAEAQLLPHLFNYIREHGPDVRRLDTVRSSYRAWIGFLMQDGLGTGVVVADITPHVVARFRRWRTGPHSWAVPWDEKIYRHESKGVGGLAIQRNIEDLRAALGHAEGEKRIEAPRLPSVDKKLRTKQRPAKVLTVKELGALFGYAKGDDIYRELALMLATGCRPGAAQAFKPDRQWLGATIDMQPDRPETNKKNAICPTIAPIKSVLKAWKAKPHDIAKSRKKWWRTARRALGADIRAYDIRHTVATMLDNAGVPGVQISGVLGHTPATRNTARTTRAHYLHYDPDNAPQLKRALTNFFGEVMTEAALWSADHLRTIPVRGKPVSIASKAKKC